MEDCENLLLIPRINKALESDAGFPSIPVPAMEGQDPSTSGESQFTTFVWSLAL